MIELVAFALAVAVIGVVGVRVGMLVAPRLGRWAEREEDRDDD
jgi:hypothetical protein